MFHTFELSILAVTLPWSALGSAAASMPGPERRSNEIDKRNPYSRPTAAHPAPASSVLDAATQAAIQAAAEAAARAAIAAQQQRAAAAAMAGPQAGGLAAAAGIAGLPQGMSNFVKVSGESDPRKVAGKLAHTCRDNPAPAMLTIGTKCINQAVKAICIARGEQRSCIAYEKFGGAVRAVLSGFCRQQAADQAVQGSCCTWHCSSAHDCCDLVNACVLLSDVLVCAHA